MDTFQLEVNISGLKFWTSVSTVRIVDEFSIDITDVANFIVSCKFTACSLFRNWSVCFRLTIPSMSTLQQCVLVFCTTTFFFVTIVFYPNFVNTRKWTFLDVCVGIHLWSTIWLCILLLGSGFNLSHKDSEHSPNNIFAGNSLIVKICKTSFKRSWYRAGRKSFLKSLNKTFCKSFGFWATITLKHIFFIIICLLTNTRK